MRTYERIIMLNIIDAQWKDHLLALDHLKQGIGLVGYGQKDPLVEYKKESFDLFQAMLDRIDTTTIRSLFNLQVSPKNRRKKFNAAACGAPPRPLDAIHRPNQGAPAPAKRAAKSRPSCAISQSRPQRSLPLRLRQEVQEVPRHDIKNPGRSFSHEYSPSPNCELVRHFFLST
jgi:preprotein translocase subunit SecA